MNVNARLRELYPDSEELFDIVLMTNNHAQVGVRLINSINYYGMEIRCVMPIQSEGGRCQVAPFLSLVDFECSFQKTKNNIFYIWYNLTNVIKSFSASYYQLLNSNLRLLAGTEPETDTFLQHNQSHTILLSLWMQWPIRGVQMSHR